jgi:hypothetical protein
MSGLDGLRFQKAKKERCPLHTRTNHDNQRPALFLNSSLSSLFDAPHSRMVHHIAMLGEMTLIQIGGFMQISDVVDVVEDETAASQSY